MPRLSGRASAAIAAPIRGARKWGESLPETLLREWRHSSDRSLDELDHGVDRLACRDDETAASFDKGD